MRLGNLKTRLERVEALQASRTQEEEEALPDVTPYALLYVFMVTLPDDLQDVLSNELKGNPPPAEKRDEYLAALKEIQRRTLEFVPPADYLERYFNAEKADAA